jgi:hypothetical protein
MTAVVAIISFCLGCLVGGIFVLSIREITEIFDEVEDEYFSNKSSRVDEKASRESDQKN